MEITTTLPEDLLNEVLLCLPLKSLARFKCVSRHWQTVISDRRFVKTVLERYPEPNSTLLHLPQGVLIFPLRCNGDVSSEIVELRKLPLAPELRLKGTYHGLVFSSNCKGSSACVWNPLTGQVNYFNFKSHSCAGYWCSVFGFGLDTIKDDYKAVKISGTTDSLVIEIYQLKNCETREIVLPLAEVPYKFSFKTPVTINGSSHWIGFHTRNKVLQIVRFDMDHEKFVEIPFSTEMPNIEDEDYVYQIDIGFLLLGYGHKEFFLGSFRGSLCLFISDPLNLKLEAWSMKCNNYDQSDVVWTRIFKVGLSYWIGEVYAFTADNEVLFGTRSNMGYCLIDPWNERCVSPSTLCLPTILEAVTYVESLVSVRPQ